MLLCKLKFIYVAALATATIALPEVSMTSPSNGNVKDWSGIKYDEFVAEYGLGDSFGFGRDIVRHQLGADEVFVVIRDQLWIKEVYTTGRDGKVLRSAKRVQDVLSRHKRQSPRLDNLSSWIGACVTQFRAKSDSCRQISLSPNKFSAIVEKRTVMMFVDDALIIQSIWVWEPRKSSFVSVETKNVEP